MSVGIDVAKKKLDICLFNHTIPHKHFTISNSVLGVQKLIKILEENDLKATPIVMESTGNYHIICMIMLIEEGFSKVKLVNPIISSRFFNAEVRKRKTDRIDAEKLAHLGIVRKLPNVKISRKQIMSRKKLNMLNTLESKYQAIKMSLRQFKKVCEDLGEEDELTFESLEGAMELIKKQIKEIKDSLIEDCSDNKLFKRLSKINGVSDKSAACICTVIEGKEFRSKRALVGYAGLDISKKESGNYRGKGKITKRGNSYLRKVLFQTSWGLIMHNERFRAYYDRKRGEGRHYFEVLNMLSRKVLHIIYGLQKNNMDFSLDMV